MPEILGSAMSRHLDERLALRFPALFRLLAGRATSLPPSSALRRRVAERSLSRGFEALSRGDLEFMLLTLAPDVEFNYLGGGVGFAERYRGHEGVREFTRDWIAAWGNADYEVEHVIDLGDRIVYRYKVIASGGSSGAEVTNMQGGVAYLGDGVIRRIDTYWHWWDLVEALGLTH
jgi:ketosteroid isomerase-like protein